MISKAELIRWLGTLPPDANVAIEEDGISIQQVVEPGEEIPFLEVGGLPDHFR